MRRPPIPINDPEETSAASQTRNADLSCHLFAEILRLTVELLPPPDPALA